MEQFKLEGKIALVTGASYGIGFTIASALAGAGTIGSRDQLTSYEGYSVDRKSVV